MHCQSCNQNLENSLSKIKGVQNVKANFQDNIVRLEFDENKVELEKIRATIRKIGFMSGVEQIG